MSRLFYGCIFGLALIILGLSQVKTAAAANCVGNCISSAGIACDTKNNGAVIPKATIEALVKDRDSARKRGDTAAVTRLDQELQEKTGVLTAIGCIPTEPKALVAGLLKVAVGAGGGIAFLLMIFGAFQMITSAGNPEGVKKGSEQLTSAVIGLLFVIFSVMLLQIIGVDILQIPGFGK